MNNDLLYKFVENINFVRHRIYIDEIICGEKLTISKVTIKLKDFYKTYGISSSMFENDKPEHKFEKIIKIKNVSFEKLYDSLNLNVYYNRAIIVSIINAISSFIVKPFIDQNPEDSINENSLINKKNVKNQYIKSNLSKDFVKNVLLYKFFPDLKNNKNQNNDRNNKNLVIFKSLENYSLSNSIANINYSNKKIAMVGYFKPIVKYLALSSKEIGVIDLNKENEKQAIENGLKKISYNDLKYYDIIIISGTSIINNTLNELLKYTNNSEIVLMGPSVPVFSYFFLRNNLEVNYLAGRIVLDYEKAKKTIIMGGSTKDLKDSCLKITTKVL